MSTDDQRRVQERNRDFAILGLWAFGGVGFTLLGIFEIGIVCGLFALAYAVLIHAHRRP